MHNARTHHSSKPAVTNIGSLFAGVLGQVAVRVTPSETVHYPANWKSRAKPEAAKPAVKKQVAQKKVTGSAEPRLGRKEKTAAQKPTAKKVTVKKPVAKKADMVEQQPISNASQTFISASGKDVQVMTHEQMQREMGRLAVAAEQAEAVKPASRNAKPVATTKTGAKKTGEQATKEVGKIGKKALVFPSHLVHVPASREYAIIFECSKKLILTSGDLQIGSSTGGAKALPKEAGQDAVSRVHLQSVRADMVTFDRHCTISGINILAIPGSSLCRVFVNFKSAIDDSGKHWGEGTDYEKFLARTLFGRKWNKVSIKDEAGKTSISLKNPDSDPKGAAELLLAFSE